MARTNCNNKGKNTNNVRNNSKKRRNSGANAQNYKKNYRVEDSYDPNYPNRETGKGYNAPSWYMGTDPKVAKQVYSYSFETAAGVPLRMNGPTDLLSTAPKLEGFEEIIPTVMDVSMAPAMSNISAINAVALKLYTQFSHDNNKTTKYQPADLIMAVGAIGSCIAMYSHMARMLRFAGTVNSRNRAFPKLVLTAMGVDYDDLIAHFTDYRTEFNLSLQRAKAIVFPGNIDYFEKCRSQFANVFTDDPDNLMAQVYIPRPSYLWQINESVSSKGTVLQTVDVLRKGTFGQLQDQFDSMLEALMHSSTLQYVYADVLRVASNSSLTMWSMEPVYNDSVESMLPKYDKEWLLQLRNSIIVGSPAKTTHENHTKFNDVLTDAGTLSVQYNPYFANTMPALAYDHILDFDTMDPSEEEKVTAVTYQATARQLGYDTTSNKWYPTTTNLPIFYITAVRIYGAENSADPILTLTESGTTDLEKYGNSARILGFFTEAPRIYFFSVNPSTHDAKYVGSVGDLHYYTTIDNKVYKNMSALAYYSIFSIK